MTRSTVRYQGRDLDCDGVLVLGIRRFLEAIIAVASLEFAGASALNEDGQMLFAIATGMRIRDNLADATSPRRNG